MGSLLPFTALSTKVCKWPVAPVQPTPVNERNDLLAAVDGVVVLVPAMSASGHFATLVRSATSVKKGGFKSFSATRSKEGNAWRFQRVNTTL